MQQQNPILVQTASQSKCGSAPPLILIHDGGGTAFAYFCLGQLGREVWAIHNPHYSTAEPWYGGPEEMARHYIHLIHKAGLTGKVLLGGWSLGGYLSLLIARLLAQDPEPPFYVVGMVIVDSPYHIPASRLPSTSRELDIGEMPVLIQKSFDNCDDMLHVWELPSWEHDPTLKGPSMRCSIRGETFVLDHNQVLYCPASRLAGVIDAEPYSPSSSSSERSSSADLSSPPGSPVHPSKMTSATSNVCTPTSNAAPPPAVLIRCYHYTPTTGPTNADPVHLDIFRDQVLLGWDKNYPPFIKAVFDVDSHHFNVFDFQKVDDVTAKIKDGIELLDTIRPVM